MLDVLDTELGKVGVNRLLVFGGFGVSLWVVGEGFGVIGSFFIALKSVFVIFVILMMLLRLLNC